jgi:ATP-binding cassette, subfamily B, bacterial CvaB/MchF/RaxB
MNLLVPKFLAKRRPVPSILQAGYAECGICCCLSLMRHFGMTSLTIDAVRQTHPAGGRGYSLRQLLDLFSDYGVTARPARLELTDLESLAPCIIHWNFNHFVVLESFNGKAAIIMDPAIGRHRISRQRLSDGFTGIAILAEPNDQLANAPRASTSATAIDLLRKQLIANRGGLAGAILLTLLVTISVALLPLFMGYFLDEIAPKNRVDLLPMACLILAAVVINIFIIQIFRAKAISAFRAAISRGFFKRIFSSLVFAEYPYFQNRAASSIVNQYRSAGSVSTFFSDQLITRLVDLISLIAAIASVGIYSATVALTLIAYVIISFSIYAFVAPGLRARLANIIQAEGKESACFVETVNNIAAMKVFGRETARLGMLLGLRDSVELAISDYGSARGRVVATQDFLGNAFWALAVVITLIALLGGVSSVGTFTAVVTWVGSVVARTRDVGMGLLDIDYIKGHLAKTEDILAARAHPAPPELRADTAAITLSDVEFCYPGNNTPTLAGCSAQFPVGEFTTIVGPSGVGKTTLLMLLAGLLMPRSGSITLPAGLAAHDSGRRSVGAVFQGDGLFNTSILNNISMFDPIPDLERAQHAASLSVIHADIIALPMGYETIVGDGGQGLSAGQAQRVILARALYNRPKLILLDEFSSNLDEPSELEILGNLKSERVTVISVAHRPQVIEFCDNLLELSDGCLVNRSGHDARSDSRAESAASR